MLRTRFKKDIVCEFLPGRKKSRRVIIYCGGMPSVPSKKVFMEFWARKGYWVFFPRYRGSWESKGNFLELSPDKDVVDVIDGISEGFVDLWAGKKYKVDPTHVFLFGCSFGGPAAILASRDFRVNKSVCISPVTDWLFPSKDEPLDWLYGYVKDAFGEGYRLKKAEWKKLTRGKFYNPQAHVDELEGEKLLLIHAKDDRSVAYRSVKKFAREVDCELYTLARGGHLSGSIVMKPRIYRKVHDFLNS